MTARDRPWLQKRWIWVWICKPSTKPGKEIFQADIRGSGATQQSQQTRWYRRTTEWAGITEKSASLILAGCNGETCIRNGQKADHAPTPLAT